MPRRARLVPTWDELQPNCTPAPMFCCGCTLGQGMYFILVFHFVALLVEFVTSARTAMSSNVSPRAIQVNMFFLAFSLAGVPFILAGIIGALHCVQANVRAYFYYLVLSCIINIVCEIVLLAQDPCSKLPGDLYEILRVDDKMMCPTFRACQWFLLIGTLCVQGYVIYIVWSYCQHLDINREKLLDTVWNRKAALSALIKGVDRADALANTQEEVPYGSVGQRP